MTVKWKDVGEGMGGALIILGSLLSPFLRNYRLHWGATDAEINGTLTGDELIRHPRWQYTNALTIDAPTADVWPWLVQLRRAGKYGWLQDKKR